MALQIQSNPGPDRENALLGYVSNGRFQVEYSTLKSTHGDHVAEFQVFSDALKIEGIRINVSAETQQKIADCLGCLLLTPKLADLMWIQREVTLKPFPRPITASTEAMVEHSSKIDAALVKLGNPTGLIQTVGKHWVIDNDIHAGKAMNYGWHFEGANFQGISGEVSATLSKDSHGQFVRLIQGRGTAHDMHHVDYSQTCVLVARGCVVDGQAQDLLAVLQDPELAPLASHQGALRVLRQPGVPDPGNVVVILPEVTV
jgi:hypothetical protein